MSIGRVALMLSSVLTLAQVGTSYDRAIQAACSNGSAVVVGVGCWPPNGEWHTATVARLDGYRAPCLVVAVGDQKTGSAWWVATLRPDTQAKDIEAIFKRPPFQQKRKYNPETQPNFQQRMGRQSAAQVRFSGSC